MRKFIFSVSIFFSLTALQAGIPTQKNVYYGPTEMLIARESWEVIDSTLQFF